jgi:hypothetical protein
MAETIFSPAEFGVVNTRPAHTLQPGELTQTSGVTVRRGDPYNIYPTGDWFRVTGLGTGVSSFAEELITCRVLTFDTPSSYPAVAFASGIRFSGATDQSWSFGPVGTFRGSLIRFNEVYLQGTGRWDEETVAESSGRLVRLRGRNFDPPGTYPFGHQFRLIEDTILNGPVSIPVSPTDGHVEDILYVDTGTTSGSSDRIGGRARDRGHPLATTVAKFYVDPSVSTRTGGSSASTRWQWDKITSTVGSGGRFAAGDVYVYWYRYYCSEYDILAPTRYDSTQNCLIVEIGSGVTATHIDLFVDGLDASVDLDIPTDSQGNCRFNKIRIFRHRCRDTDEAIDICSGKLPLTGGFVGELEFNSGTGFSTGTYFRDEDIQLFDGTVQYPNVLIEQAGQTLIFDRVAPKEPYTDGCVFQGSLLTDAPRLGQDILVYTPPNEPWYNPAPYFIQISSTEYSPFRGAVPLGSVAVVMYRDRLLRINYLPFSGETGQPVWEYITQHHGVYGRNSWARFDNEQGSFVAYVNEQGIYATDGRAWFSLSQNWKPDILADDSFNLYNDTDRECLVLHQNQPIAGKVLEWEFHYSSTHVSQQGLKVFGPTLVDIDYSIDAHEFTDPDPDASTPFGYSRELYLFSVVDGDLDIYARGFPSGAMSLTTGDLHPTNPKNSLRVQRLGFYHSDTPSNSVSWWWTKEERDQEPFTYPTQSMDTTSRGFSDFAQSITSARYLQLHMEATDGVTLGPIQITTQGDEGGKNDS